MNKVLARALMVLATACLGTSRREWAIAMQAEFEIACEMGKPLAFAAGCLIAGVRELPRHDEGRFALANHFLVLGILMPIAGLEFMCAAGAVFPNGSSLYGAPAPDSKQLLLQIDAYMAAVPLFFGLWLLLCVSHLRLAWALLEGDWQRVVRIIALVAAGTLTFVMFTSVLFIADVRMLIQAGALAIELAAIAALARWQDRLSDGEALEQLAR